MAFGACAPPPPDRDGGPSLCERRALDYLDGGASRGECPVLGCQADRSMSLTVGTGRDGTLEGFTPLRDGDPLYVIPGEQGLQHLLVGFRGQGFDGRLPLVEVRVRRASDCEEVGYVRFRLPFRADPTDPSRLAVEVVLDDLDRREYCSVLGQDVTLVIEASTPEGQWAHREVRARVAGIDPNTRPDLRDAWLAACDRRDGGAADAGPDASDAALDARDAALDASDGARADAAISDP
jgi:hypothetical protein